MKIEIEISEETAALVWANRTWEGREKYTMSEIVKDLAEEEAAKYRSTFPKAVARVVREFAKANEKVHPCGRTGDASCDE